MHIFMSFFFVLTTALTAIGRTKSVLKVNIFSVLVYVAFLLLLVPSFQDTGAAVARLGMQVVGVSVVLYMLSRYLKVQFDFEALWKSIVSSLAMLVVLMLVQHLTAGFSVYVVMLVEIVSGGCVYVLFLYLLKALDHQDFELLRKAFPPMKKYITIVEKILTRS